MGEEEMGLEQEQDEGQLVAEHSEEASPPTGEATEQAATTQQAEQHVPLKALQAERARRQELEQYLQQQQWQQQQWQQQQAQKREAPEVGSEGWFQEQARQAAQQQFEAYQQQQAQIQYRQRLYDHTQQVGQDEAVEDATFADSLIRASLQGDLSQFHELRKAKAEIARLKSPQYLAQLKEQWLSEGKVSSSGGLPVSRSAGVTKKTDLDDGGDFWARARQEYVGGG